MPSEQLGTDPPQRGRAPRRKLENEELLDIARDIEDRLTAPLFGLAVEVDHWLEAVSSGADLTNQQRALLDAALREGMALFSLEEVSGALDGISLTLARASGQFSNKVDLSGMQGQFFNIAQEIRVELPPLYSAAFSALPAGPVPQTLRSLSTYLDRITDRLVDSCYLLGLLFDAAGRVNTVPRIGVPEQAPSLIPEQEPGSNVDLEEHDVAPSLPRANEPRRDILEALHAKYSAAGEESIPLVELSKALGKPRQFFARHLNPARTPGQEPRKLDIAGREGAKSNSRILVTRRSILRWISETYGVGRNTPDKPA